MQPERGGRPRREGGRPNRRGVSSRERQAEGARGSGEGSYNRGGGSRGRGGGRGRGRRDARGRGAAAGSPSPPRASESAAADLELREEEKEQGSYSRRKIVSNWHRYEDTEKETQNDSGESQRGTDFSVLLSSAGDSFTQFRFAEEREWITENLCPKQLSGLYVDCQSLVQALEELPLHLRLNVAAELVQDATPVVLPQIKSKNNDVAKSSSAPLQQPMAQSRVPPRCYPSAASAAHLTLPTKGGDGVNPSEALSNSLSAAYQEMDHLDEDLDLLLKLDTAVNPENNFALATLHPDTASGEDLERPHKENVLSELDGTEEECSAAQQQQVTPSNITEEDLEDWLDSMIS